MKTECPFCNQKYDVADELFGKIVQCPQCKEEFSVQPLQITPPPPPKPITLMPLFTESSNKTLATIDSIKDNLLDAEEDNFVLNSLSDLKLWYLILTVLIVIVLFICASVSYVHEETTISISCLVLIIPVLGHYFLAKLALAWFRGIYRNVLRLSTSLTTSATKSNK